MNNKIIKKEFDILKKKFQNQDFVVDKTGCKLVESLGVRMELDPMDLEIDLGFRKTNVDYCKKELDWYDSMELSVKDIGKVAKIWNSCADDFGNINSNYGYLIYSKENGNQYSNCFRELMKNESSRRAIMIYNRPSMHVDAFENNKNDFICTLAHQFFIRNGKLDSIVTMRSNDFFLGLLNDVFWFGTVHQRLLKDLQKIMPDLKCGKMIHNANSLHIYERHFKYFK